MFAQLKLANHSRTKHSSINKKLFNDNIAIAKSYKRTGEKVVVQTNRGMEVHVFGIKKNGDIRTLGFIGHKNEHGKVVASRYIVKAD